MPPNGPFDRPRPVPANDSATSNYTALEGEPGIVLRNGIFHLALSSDVLLPCYQHGLPLTDLGAGWHYHSLNAIFAPIFLFELENESGARATWFFDSAGGFLGHVLGNIPHEASVMLRRKAGAVLREIVRPLTWDIHCDRRLAESGFWSIERGLRTEIARACHEPFLLPPTIKLLDDLPEVVALFSDSASEPVALIRRERLRHALSQDFQKRIIAAAVAGELTWPSLADASDQPARGTLCFDHFTFAYRIEDNPSHLLYYVLVSEHKACTIGIYFPSAGLIVILNQRCEAAVSLALPDVASSILDYFCKFGDLLLTELARGESWRIAGSMREDHIGHQLWNELSGLENLVTKVPEQRLPVIFPLRGSTNNFFGNLPSLFPELTSNIRTDKTGHDSIVQNSIRSRVNLVRYTDDFVSDGLRKRIMQVNQQTHEYLEVSQLRHQHSGAIILIGLRVENRTAVNLGEFIGRLVQHLARVWPDLLIVLDGQNTNSDNAGVQASTSFQSHTAVRSPLEAEFEAIAEIQRQSQVSGVRIEIASGKSIATSIAWAGFANCVISFWGAGLAKYRWVANRPALVLTSHNNLVFRNDLNIYNHTKYMSDPTPIEFADASVVRDDMDAPLLISIKEPSYANFHVDELAFHAQVSRFCVRFL